MPVSVGGVVSAGAPDEVTRVTTLPSAATGVPPAGFWLIVDPAGTVVLDAVVTVPTASWAATIALRAACWSSRPHSAPLPSTVRA